MADYTVKVHPVVYLTVCDAFQRRSISKKGVGRTMGSLCGYLGVDNVIHVTNAYVVPFSEDTPNGLPALDFTYNIRMRDTLRRTHKSEYLLGWFWTGEEVTDVTLQIHQYYSEIIAQQPYSKDFKCPTVLFMMNPMFEENRNDIMPIRAYIDHDAAIGNQKHGYILQSLPTTLAALPGERVALNFCKKGLQTPNREIPIDNTVNNQAERFRQLLGFLEGIKVYVDNIIKKEQEPNLEFDRKLYDIMEKFVSGKVGDNWEQITSATANDYSMVNYITGVIKAQMSAQEKIFQI
uniref:MPN domain-containing protein n=1 Tax=Parastrongyloides trichosuri TaxID=131310 RepID=A0A0N4Z1U1_PARTI